MADEKLNQSVWEPIDYTKRPLLNRFLNHLTKMLRKLSEIALSVKVLSVIGITWVNSWLVVAGYISGTNWATVQVALITTVLAMREAFKISRIMYSKNPEETVDKENLTP